MAEGEYSQKKNDIGARAKIDTLSFLTGLGRVLDKDAVRNSGYWQIVGLGV